MQKTIISDTSCLILLDNIGELDLFKTQYGVIRLLRTSQRRCIGSARMI